MEQTAGQQERRRQNAVECRSDDVRLALYYCCCCRGFDGRGAAAGLVCTGNHERTPSRHDSEWEKSKCVVVEKQMEEIDLDTLTTL